MPAEGKAATTVQTVQGGPSVIMNGFEGPVIVGGGASWRKDSFQLHSVKHPIMWTDLVYW